MVNAFIRFRAMLNALLLSLKLLTSRCSECFLVVLAIIGLQFVSRKRCKQATVGQFLRHLPGLRGLPRIPCSLKAKGLSERHWEPGWMLVQEKRRRTGRFANTDQKTNLRFVFFRFKGDGEHLTPFSEAAEWCPGFVFVLSHCDGTHWAAAVCGRIKKQVCAQHPN